MGKGAKRCLDSSFSLIMGQQIICFNGLRHKSCNFLKCLGCFIGLFLDFFVLTYGEGGNWIFRTKLSLIRFMPAVLPGFLMLSVGIERD